MLQLSAEYYFKRAVCVYVLWKNAKHAKARGAQRLERASLTQRGLLKRNFTGMLVCRSGLRLSITHSDLSQILGRVSRPPYDIYDSISINRQK